MLRVKTQSVMREWEIAGMLFPFEYPVKPHDKQASAMHVQQLLSSCMFLRVHVIVDMFDLPNMFSAFLKF